MKKKHLKTRIKILKNDLERTTRSQQYYQQQYYDVLDELDEAHNDKVNSYEEAWHEGYKAAWDNAQALTKYSQRRRVWYKLWL